MTKTILINPHDPVVARDGRPFGLGTRMKSLPWIYPSVLAGSLRTMIGKEVLNGDAQWKGIIPDLKAVEVAGPFLSNVEQIFLPAPKDLLVKEEEVSKKREKIRLKPMDNLPDDCGCDLPHKDLFPLEITEDFKPADAPVFWSMEKMTEWLSDPDSFEVPPPETVENRHKHFFYSIPQEERIHVKIEPGSQTAEDGQLYATVGLRLDEGISLVAGARSAKERLSGVLDRLDRHHPLGGERRLSHWKTVDGDSLWNVPDPVAGKLDQTDQIRMVLATPAIFNDGWKPGWLGDDLCGTPPGCSNLKMKLVSAIVDRWRPISGWDYETLGPKPVRRMVPAGSVYFLKVIEGKQEELPRSLWLQSVCDDEQDRRDGFGLSVWGVW